MSIPEQTVIDFQAMARKEMGALSREFNMELVQEDEMTFRLVGQRVEVCLYIYPSHVPSVNVALLPSGIRWVKWRQESSWGRTGIWLSLLAAFRGARVPYPDTRFRTSEELSSHVESLVCILRDVGRDILEGDVSGLAELAAYADQRVQRSTQKPDGGSGVVS